MGCLSFPFMLITAALTVEQDKHHYHTNTISFFAHTAYSSIQLVVESTVCAEGGKTEARESNRLS